MAWLLLLLPAPVTIDRVDLCELQHQFCPQSGSETGTWYLYWELREGEYRIRDWRTAATLPRPEKGIQTFWDAKSKCNRRIESKVFIESWLFYDREVVDRNSWPEAKRRKLRNP